MKGTACLRTVDIHGLDISALAQHGIGLVEKHARHIMLFALKAQEITAVLALDVHMRPQHTQGSQHQQGDGDVFFHSASGFNFSCGSS